MKIIVRLAAWYAFLGGIAAMVFVHLYPEGYSSEASPAIFLIGSYVLSGLFCFGYFFYHWGVTIFAKQSYKRFWFVALLLSPFVGLLAHFAYYLFVYEARKGVTESKSA